MREAPDSLTHQGIHTTRGRWVPPLAVVKFMCNYALDVSGNTVTKVINLYRNWLIVGLLEWPLSYCRSQASAYS